MYRHHLYSFDGGVRNFAVDDGEVVVNAYGTLVKTNITEILDGTSDVYRIRNGPCRNKFESLRVDILAAEKTRKKETVMEFLSKICKEASIFEVFPNYVAALTTCGVRNYPFPQGITYEDVTEVFPYGRGSSRGLD